MNKKLVYIASPYSLGDKAMNTHFQSKIFDEMMNDGIVMPFIPLLMHYQHISFPRQESDWLEYGLVVLKRCDAVLRLNTELPKWKYSVSESRGCDGEILEASLFDIPVFYSKTDLYKWVKAENLVKA